MVRYFAWLCVVMLLLASHACAGELLRGMAGAYQLELAFNPNPPVAGSNRLIIVAMHGKQPLKNADVQCHLDMVDPTLPPAKGKGPYKAMVNFKIDGQYKALLNFATPGKWKLTVKVAQMAGMRMAGDGQAVFPLIVDKTPMITHSRQVPIAEQPDGAAKAPTGRDFLSQYSNLLIGFLGGVLVVLVALGFNGRKR